MRKKVFVLLLALCLLVLPHTKAFASESTAYTYTMSADSFINWIRTQDAYLPTAVFLQDMGLSSPEDLYILDGVLYVADTGNRRIVVYDPETREIESFGEDVLRSPTGIHVTADGYVYVADQGNEAVYGFDDKRNLILEIYRPETYLFSDRSVYRPRKIAVSSGKTIYVAGEGAFEGLMMFDHSGEFLGYFGANPRDISFFERLQEIVYSQVQQERVLSRIPRTIHNLTIDRRDLIHTVSFSPLEFGTYSDDMYNSIRRLNMAGENILVSRGRRRIVDEANYIDIAVNKHGCIIALTSTGVITEYDPRGQVVFSLGGRAMASERIGFLSSPIAIAVDDNNYLYVLDRGRELVQVFVPTDYAMATHRAIDAFEAGDYAGSLALWEDLLLLNGMSQIARNGYGMSLSALGRYEEAMEEFVFTFNRMDYSDAFWEIRNIWITRHITNVVTGLIIFWILWMIVSIWNKKTKVLTRFFARFKRDKRTKGGLVKEVLYAFTMFRDPLDAYYNLKVGRRGTLASAFVLYALAFTVYVSFMLLTAFLFRFINNINTVSPITMVVSFITPVSLWITANYLVSSINDGEGSFKNVVVCTAYAFTPFIVLMPFIILLSYALTFNEYFIFSISSGLVIVFTAVYFYLMVQEVHNYTFGGAIFNIFLTLFAILIALVGFLIVYLLAKQAAGFITDVFGEVFFRVT